MAQQQTGIKKMILRELAKHKAVGLTNFELSEKLGLTKTQVNDSLRESTGNGYVLKGESLGIEGINYTITEKGLNYLNLKESALEQTEKTPTEPAKPAPIVTESALEQIEPVKKNPLDTSKITESSLINTPATSSPSIIEDFETRATPDYYKGKSIEVFDVLNEFLTPEANAGFFVGNIIKYVVRYRGKNGCADLLKARDYLDKLIEVTK
jgi:hypothetical protein